MNIHGKKALVNTFTAAVQALTTKLLQNELLQRLRVKVQLFMRIHTGGK